MKKIRSLLVANRKGRGPRGSRDRGIAGRSTRSQCAGRSRGLAVKPGQEVEKGAPLFSIEAMKMEAMLTTDRVGVIKAVHVKPGNVVSAKDLLVENQ